MLKLELAIVLSAVAGGALWVEQGHRVVIDAPAADEAQSVAAAAACPDNDTMPTTPAAPTPQRAGGKQA
jgi:hypothetical protein